MNKKLIFPALPILVLAGCSTFGFTADEGKLKETASFDHHCPVENITIDENQDDVGLNGTGRFRLTVCGKKFNYERLGKLYRQRS